GVADARCGPDRGGQTPARRGARRARGAGAAYARACRRPVADNGGKQNLRPRRSARGRSPALGPVGAARTAPQSGEAPEAAPEAALLRLRIGLQVAAELLGAGAPGELLGEGAHRLAVELEAGERRRLEPRGLARSHD